MKSEKVKVALSLSGSRRHSPNVKVSCIGEQGPNKCYFGKQLGEGALP